MNAQTKPVLTKEQEQKLVALAEALKKCPTISAKIRYLDSQKMTRGDISRFLGIRYQWVRNVLITPVKAPKA